MYFLVYSICPFLNYMFSYNPRTSSYMFSSTKKQFEYCTQYSTAVVHVQLCTWGRVMSTAGDGELALRARSYYAACAARSLSIMPLALRARLPCLRCALATRGPRARIFLIDNFIFKSIAVRKRFQ